MKKMAVIGIFAGIAVVGGAAWASDGWWSSWFGGKTETAAPATPMADAPQAPIDPAMANLGNLLDLQASDRVMGSMMAPVTVIEYASMTCSHCADFEMKTLPEVKKDWIDSGKVKYVMRDLAWDNLAVGMIKVARCAEPEKFYPIVESLFANQAQIATSDKPLAEIERVASAFGMDKAKVDACIKDPALHEQVENSKKIAMEGLGIRGTPTLFVNGQRIDGAVEYDDMKKTLAEQYAKATQAK